jgi:hypothetical protein
LAKIDLEYSSDKKVVGQPIARLPEAHMLTLLDHEIAHIVRVMGPSLREDLGGPILPARYWRERLYRLLDSGHLTKAQLCSIDELLLELDQFEAEQHASSAAAGAQY